MHNRVASGLGAAALMVLAGAAQAQLYEQDFVQGQPSPGQCTAWQAFAAELVPQEYTLLTLSGSVDPVGVSCSDPDMIAAIAAAINTNNQNRLTYPCDGRNWMTGGCGGGVELSAANSICSCPNPEYIVRPCIGNANWGGVNGPTCGGVTQTITVEFQAGPPQPTACCKEDASCEMLLPDECEGQNGIVHRNKACEDVQCAWACCLPDGSCESLSSQACDAQNGIWHEDQACEDVQCTFACCLPDGSCESLTELTCNERGGIWNENSACEDVACTGACCLPDDTCEVLSEQECADAQGRYNEGLACENVNCEIPTVLMSTNQGSINNPRARSFGFTVVERSITDIVASQDLPGFDMVWINPNISVGDYAQLRAGVAENGSLDMYAKGGGNLVINTAGNSGNQADIAPGGVDYNRTVTHQAEIFNEPQHPYLTGEGYGGVALQEAEFNNWGSTDHGWLEQVPDGITVLRNPEGPSWVEYGHGGGIVIVTTLTYGWGGGGGRLNPLDNHIKYGPFAPGPQGPSACCLEDASCEMLEVDECQGRNGIPKRFRTCDEVTCAYACCLPDGTCESLSSQACDAQGGIWNEGSTCDDVVCTGACCKQDRTCEVLSEQECGDVDGRYNKGKACNEVNCSIGSIVVGGNATDNIVRALTDLGLDFTLQQGVDPAPDAADIIIIGRDGGQALANDYRDWLAGGGDLILTGGSSLAAYCTDISDRYFNTDGSCGWHTDGNWNSLGEHPANEGLPTPYTFLENGHTFHMLHFLNDTPDTTIYGTNDEVNNVAAFREYDNGGSFNYMALDLGIRANDEDNFITPWVAAAINAASASADTCQYTIKKSKAKGGCLSCPLVGDNLSTETPCELVEDCAKRVRTIITCPNEAGTCRLKGKRTSCG